MKNDVWAGLDHVTLSDQSPHHTRSPPGEGSWCWFRRQEAMKGKGKEVEQLRHRLWAQNLKIINTTSLKKRIKFSMIRLFLRSTGAVPIDLGKMPMIIFKVSKLMT